jgi:hypothetical protein
MKETKKARSTDLENRTYWPLAALSAFRAKFPAFRGQSVVRAAKQERQRQSKGELDLTWIASLWLTRPIYGLMAPRPAFARLGLGLGGGGGRGAFELGLAGM